ncbi:MAG TPA: TlpA disulfide reductase family protein [Segetibacter sp.]
MKSLCILFVSLAFAVGSIAQSDTAIAKNDSLAPYQKTSYMPSFTIRTPDSSWFSKLKLKAKKPTLILYFSPDCGHCQMETEEVISKMKELAGLQIVMVTSRPFEDMKNFADHYKIERFPSIKIGTDPARLITRFYDVKTTPFSALYDQQGKLVTVYRDQIDFDELIAFLHSKPVAKK